MPSQEMIHLKEIMKKMMEQGFVASFTGDIDPMQLRKVIQLAQDNMQLTPNVSFIPETINGIECEISMPDNHKEDAIIFYIHGGGLICGNAKSSRGYASILANESKYPVYSISYRLAPEDPYPAAIDDCMAVYQFLIEKYDKPIFLIGESGGAYLSLVIALKAKKLGLKLPNGIVPYSAPIDFSSTIDRNFIGNEDFTVTPDALDQLAKWYEPNGDLKNPEVSPYYDDFNGLCPMFLAWDENESLAKDNEILRDKAIEANVEVVWKSYPHCFHAFATAGPGTPESYEVLKDTVAFFNNHLD